MGRLVFKVRFLWFVVFALVAGVWPLAAQANGGSGSAGGSGAAAGFAVLADGTSTGLTCTTSTVTGLVGVSSITTPVHGSCGPVVQVAADAYANFVATYNGIAGSLGPCTQTFTSDNTLDGLSLGPGVYCVAAGATLTGTLTLTGNGPWYFEIGTGGPGALTGKNLTVVGSNPCNAFWWVRNDVTFTTSVLQGTILGGGDITLTGTNLTGRAWAGGTSTPALPVGAVTMTDSNVFGCTSAVQAPPRCLAARQALAANVAQDRIEDRAEKAAEMAEKDSDKDNKKHSDKDNKRESDADKREDKAELAKTRALQKAVLAACGPGRHHDNH
jgi:hypothetical protein